MCQILILNKEINCFYGVKKELLMKTCQKAWYRKACYRNYKQIILFITFALITSNWLHKNSSFKLDFEFGIEP